MQIKPGRKLASALKYEPETDIAPRVTATGKGVIAEAIIEKARLYEIPIRENPPLAEMLSAIPLGTEIPVDLYEVIAEIFVQILSLDQKGITKV